MHQQNESSELPAETHFELEEIYDIEEMDEEQQTQPQQAGQPQQQQAAQAQQQQTTQQADNSPFYSLIKPAEYTMEQLRHLLQDTWLSAKCNFIYHTNNVVLITRNLRSMLNKEGTSDREKLLPCLSCSCMLFMMSSPNDPQRRQRGYFVNRVLQAIDSTEPLTVDEMVFRVLADLQVDNPNTDLGIIELANFMCNDPVRGRAMGVCLLWAVCGRKIDLEITMHRFRALSELTETLRKFKVENFMNGVDSLRALYCFLKSLIKILQVVLFCDNTDLKNAGYPSHFFTIQEQQIKCVQDWGLILVDSLDVFRSTETHECAYMASVCLEESERFLNLLENIKPESIETPQEPIFNFPNVQVDCYSDLSDD